jgi:hypothetical protein
MQKQTNMRERRPSYKREFKSSLVSDKGFRTEISDTCLSSQKNGSKYLEIFDVVQDFLTTKDKDTGKYITMYLYMTYIEECSFQRVSLPEDIITAYQDLITEMINDPDFYPQEHIKLLLLQIEQEALRHMISCHDSTLASRADAAELQVTKSLIQKSIRLIHKKLNGNKISKH